jgi:hypothetical protein
MTEVIIDENNPTVTTEPVEKSTSVQTLEADLIDLQTKLDKYQTEHDDEVFDSFVSGDYMALNNLISALKQSILMIQGRIEARKLYLAAQQSEAEAGASDDTPTDTQG